MVKKNNKFQKISIYSSINSREISQISEHIKEIIKSFGLELLIPKSSTTATLKKVRALSDNYIKTHSDLIIAIGGDGTLLSCARKFGSKGIPVVGVNLGNLGFLTDIAPQELTSSLKQVLNGQYISEERIFLQASVNDEKTVNLALNEIVIHSKEVAQLIEYELFIDDEFVFRQRADGILVGSPTGSTAYSLSANGPLIHPEVQAISIMSMFAHSLNTRPLIVKDDSKVIIKICKKGSSKLSLDSHKTFQLKTNDLIRISRSEAKLLLIHPLNHDFYSACRTKLGWSLGMKTNIDRNKQIKL
jgi:NAD+ kinase